jgi:hypothetical protein
MAVDLGRRIVGLAGAQGFSASRGVDFGGPELDHPGWTGERPPRGVFTGGVKKLVVHPPISMLMADAH